jgi:uncharacterized membrane protein SpoIIM required for sporulation
VTPSKASEVAFVEARQREWGELDETIRAAGKRRGKGLPAAALSRFSPLYRDVCADLSRAQAAGFSGTLVDYLQGLTASAHALLYVGAGGDGRQVRSAGAAIRAALEAFPRAVRRHKVAMAVAFVLFFMPFLGGLLGALASNTFATRVVPEGQLRPLVEAYAHGFGADRGAGADAEMAGFYVDNNVGIALRCFATGIALGLGSAFYLVENGLITGAVVGYVTSHGAGDNILTFIVGHSSLELGAIVLAGGAGLSLGWSIVSPGARTRLESLQENARDVSTVVFGAAAMLLVAAAVEGFWSASDLPSAVKRVVGGVLFLVVAAYLGFAGRDRARDGARWT